jgi:hypothetical protein
LEIVELEGIAISSLPWIKFMPNKWISNNGTSSIKNWNSSFSSPWEGPSGLNIPKIRYQFYLWPKGDFW